MMQDILSDSHAHLDDVKFEGERDKVIERAKAAGIGFLMNPGCEEKSSAAAVALSQEYDIVYAGVGFHPSDCASFRPTVHEKMMRDWCGQAKVLAIGEIGLDYYYDDGAPKDLQKKVFEAQLGYAGEWKMPVIIHDRDAHKDCLDLVRNCMNRDSSGVFHCYSGSVEMAREILDLGMMIGIGGALTFKNARKAPDVVAYMPMDRLLIETDSPYMAPVPHRGKRNESSYVAYVAEKVAEIKGLTVEEVRTQTYENCRTLFRLHAR